MKTRDSGRDGGPSREVIIAPILKAPPWVPGSRRQLPRAMNAIDRTLKALEELHHGPITIVEAGRAPNFGHGRRLADLCSTSMWESVAWRSGGRLYTLESDPQGLETGQWFSQFHLQDFVRAEPADVVSRWLEERPGETIHLLDLDTLRSDGPDRADARHVEDTLAAAPAMVERGLVLFRNAPGDDDEGLEEHGGPAAVYLCRRGFELLWAEDGWVLLAVSPGSWG